VAIYGMSYHEDVANVDRAFQRIGRSWEILRRTDRLLSALSEVIVWEHTPPINEDSFNQSRDVQT